MRSEDFRKKVEAAPENRLFRFSLGQALFEEGAYAEAVEHLEFCCEQQSDWMMPRILLGQALMRLQQTDEARRTLESALQLAIAQKHEGPEAELRALLAELDR